MIIKTWIWKIKMWGYNRGYLATIKCKLEIVRATAGWSCQPLCCLSVWEPVLVNTHVETERQNCVVKICIFCFLFCLLNSKLNVNVLHPRNRRSEGFLLMREDQLQHCREHKNLVIGVSRLPVLNCGMIFHMDFGGRDCLSTPYDHLSNLIYLATEALSDSTEFISAIQINLSIYLSIYLSNRP